MGLSRVGYFGVLAALAGAQDCGVNTSLSVGSPEDAASLAASLLLCSSANFTVQWNGEVSMEQTIIVTNGISLTVAGDGPGALADGGGSTQLFLVDGGSSLHLSDLTLRNGYASSGGGAIMANQSSVSFTGNMSFISNSAAGSSGGAILAIESTVSWVGDGTEFSNNFADFGGAILASDSSVSWDGDGTRFISNFAGSWGGAIFAYSSATVYWDGDGTQFHNNSAGQYGGGIFVFDGPMVSWDGHDTNFSSNSAGEWGGAIVAYNSSTVSWSGDGTQFSNNSADYGGAIFAIESSTVNWDGDGTHFTSNSASFWGGAICPYNYSTLSWVGDDTQFSDNSAGAGGAILSWFATVSWVGDGTQFRSNSAETDGGALSAWFSSIVSWDGTTTFESNTAGDNGGGLHSNGCDSTSAFSGSKGDTATGATFVNNRARYGGGLYLSTCKAAFNFTGFTFEKNSAFDGGAVALYESGSETHDLSVVFFNSTFTENVANGSGGAVETLCGQHEFISCEFEGNAAGEEKQTSYGHSYSRDDRIFV